MKNIKIGLFLGFVLLVSCDISVDYFAEINEKPVLNVYLKNQQVEFYHDSIKVGHPLGFEYEIQDEEDLVLQVDKQFKNMQIGIDNQTFSILAEGMGTFQMAFFCYDSFNEISEFEVNLLAFVNLPPVCKMECNVFTGLELEVDLKESFDRDKRFGGEIILYEYDLNGYKFTSENQTIRHIFGNGGEKKISCRVKDNDEVWSQWQTQFVDVF